MKEKCIKCGMVANVDPWTHQSRYGHAPVVIREGREFHHAGDGSFRPAKEKR